jgi:hypothetical protein
MRAAEQALGADSPVSSLYSCLRGRTAQAQRSPLLDLEEVYEC